MDWTENNHYMHGVLNRLPILYDPIRIAGFDLDDTIISKPKKGEKWKIIDKNIIPKIKELVNDNYIIVIFTNQGGMSLNKNFNK
jgi:bifunctional polynucleotide phosphatase/kinase